MLSKNPSSNTNRCNSTSFKEINFVLFFNYWSASSEGRGSSHKIFASQALCINCFKKMVTGGNQPSGSKVFEMSLSICLLVKTFASKFSFLMWETLKTKRSSLCCQTIPSVFIAWSLSKNSNLSFA